MIDDATLAERGAQTVRANGIDIAYVEAGDGPAARPAPRRPRLDRSAVGRQPRRLRGPHGHAGEALPGHRPRHPRQRRHRPRRRRRIVLRARRRRPRPHRRAGTRPPPAGRVLRRRRHRHHRRDPRTRRRPGPGGARRLRHLQPRSPRLRHGTSHLRRQPRSHRGRPRRRRGRLPGHAPMAATFAHDEGRLRQRPG